MNIKIHNIDAKLEELRQRYKVGSPAMRAWILAGAKLLKKEKELLESKLENSAKKEQEEQTSIL